MDRHLAVTSKTYITVCLSAQLCKLCPWLLALSSSKH